MAKSSNHRGAFIFGSLLGGAVGAAAALWNTPQSGRELRQKLGFESEPVMAVTGAVKTAGQSVAGAASSTGGPGASIQDRALSFIENATAPLVGVTLGETANNSQPTAGVADTAEAAAAQA